MNTPYKKLFSVGDPVMVFNSIAWEQNGGDTKTNREFWQEAIVSNSYIEENGDRWLADVRFKNGLESNGHFQYMMDKIQ